MREAAPMWVRAAALLVRALPTGRYRAIRELRRRPPAPFWMRLPGASGGYLFKCDLRDTIAGEVCFTGQYEPQETALLGTILKPGMTFVDVGANWGYFTLVAARLVGDGGRVVSLEPDPRLFTTLRDNVMRNELQHVTAVQVAAAADTGVLTLAGYDDRGDKWGLSKLVEHTAPDATTFQVATVGVDDLLDEHGIRQVDLLKMDIEGAEELAINGMREGLAKHRYHRILLELHPTILAERGRTMGDVVELLAGHGYRGWWIDHSPATNRSAAYARSLAMEKLMRPLDVASPADWPADTWPHTLWLSPEVAS